ncbi:MULTISPECIES: aminotransferase class I/II-fold pyridoxal phosphate-dependent enzyme [unclassified Streptomyces]|uniref:aminotransferase class I/II-fold pyridoxal phosphate-dependent enzyme n=1 Tax=unclassified Streptomyces TaxID=2593676 RepID=UPI00336AE151
MPEYTASWLRDLQSSEFVTAYHRGVAAGNLPFFRNAESLLDPVVTMEGTPRLMLGSPNYLGLASHPRVLAGAKAAVDRYGTSLTGSRILNGTTALHREMEEELADWLGVEATLLFTTGFQTNIGTISALVGVGDTVVSDSFAHASMLDGAGLSRAKLRGFRHNRMDLFADSVRRAKADGGRILVILDGLYSMEGDLPPLDEMLDICRENDAAVMLDEAHSLGVLGEHGTGAAEVFGVQDQIDIRMGALSKALAGVGGFIAGSRELIDYLQITARAFVFTTVGVPAALGGSLEAIRIRRSPEGDQLAEQLRRNSRFLRTELKGLGLPMGPDSDLPERTTPIIPVILGDDDLAMEWWRQLYDRGVFTGVALYPGVPPTGAMLRICPMATHTQAQLEQALEVFAEVQKVMKRKAGTP